VSALWEAFDRLHSTGNKIDHHILLACRAKLKAKYAAWAGKYLNFEKLDCLVIYNCQFKILSFRMCG
jgi:hypothetical protein